MSEHTGSEYGASVSEPKEGLNSSMSSERIMESAGQLTEQRKKYIKRIDELTRQRDIVIAVAVGFAFLARRNRKKGQKYLQTAMAWKEAYDVTKGRSEALDIMQAYIASGKSKKKVA